MKQYCQYCAFCFDAGDEYRCSNHPKGEQPHWNEVQIKRANNCPNFALSDMGSIISGKEYKPRKKDDYKADRYTACEAWGVDRNAHITC